MNGILGAFSAKDRQHFMHFLNILEANSITDLRRAKEILHKEITEFHDKRQKKYRAERTAKGMSGDPLVVCEECRNGFMFDKAVVDELTDEKIFYTECTFCGLSILKDESEVSI